MDRKIILDGGLVPVARIKNQTLLDTLLDLELIEVREHFAGEYVAEQCLKAGIHIKAVNFDGMPLGGGNHKVKFEHECYDVGHLYNLKFCMDQGLFKAPIFLQFVMGILGGISAELDNLMFMKQTADKLFGKDFQWSVIGAGAQQMRLASVAAQMGGHVRVGLEDSLYIARGQMAQSNAEQVAKIRRILEEQGNEIATPDEARTILNLKGADQVHF